MLILPYCLTWWLKIYLCHVACERTVLCPVVDFCVLNCLPNFQFRNSRYYSLISKWFLPFRFSCLILFKHFSLLLLILLLRNPWRIECQTMAKLTVLWNTTSFNLVDMNLSDCTMSNVIRLESEYTHTHARTLLENIPSTTGQGLQKKKILLPSCMLVLILWKANYLTFQIENLQSHLTMTKSSSFYCNSISYVWVILFTKMLSWISLIKNNIRCFRDGKKIQCNRTNLRLLCN